MLGRTTDATQAFLLSQRQTMIRIIGQTPSRDRSPTVATQTRFAKSFTCQPISNQVSPANNIYIVFYAKPFHDKRVKMQRDALWNHKFVHFSKI